MAQVPVRTVGTGHRPQLEGHRARFHRPHSADTRIKPYRFAAFAKLIRAWLEWRTG